MSAPWLTAWVRTVSLWLIPFIALGLALPAGPVAAGTIWLGNDNGGSVFQTDTAGAVLRQLPSLPTTGIAFDGANLYFTNSSGLIAKRTSDGATVLDSFTISGLSPEDMAWDTTRSRLWRLDHDNKLHRLNAGTHSEDVVFQLPTTFLGFGNIGGLGLAYDAGRDRLYASFCHTGCADLVSGIVLSIDPTTGAILGELYATSGFATGGLGYDPLTDTLWVGDSRVIRNMTLGGAVLSSFARPLPGGFVDGLEFISGAPVPGPGALSSFALGGLVLAAAGWIRRSSRRRASR